MKSLTPILICLLLVPFAGTSQQSMGPSPASNSLTLPILGSSATWTDGSFASASDNKYATFGDIPGNAGNFTDYLVLNTFGFNVPPATIITGIEVNIERSDPNGLTADNSIRIIKPGIFGETEKSTGAPFPLTDAVETVGGQNDLWGESWSYKDVCNNEFGVAISAKRTANGGVTLGGIDNVTVTVYYRFITLPLLWQDVSVKKQGRTAVINWKTSEESDINDYLVQRSTDGEKFITLSDQPALNRSIATYTFTDLSPVTGNSYYRIQSRENSGLTKYSKLLKLHFEKNELFILFPSPWNKGTDLFINNPLREELKVQFYAVSGMKLAESTTNTEKLVMPVQVKGGMVYYRITDKNEQLKGSGSLEIN